MGETFRGRLVILHASWTAASCGHSQLEQTESAAITATRRRLWYNPHYSMPSRSWLPSCLEREFVNSETLHAQVQFLLHLYIRTRLVIIASCGEAALSNQTLPAVQYNSTSPWLRLPGLPEGDMGFATGSAASMHAEATSCTNHLTMYADKIAILRVHICIFRSNAVKANVRP
jgi:hypothetical protein